MKRNIRKIPEHLFAKLKTMKCDEIVVGCAVKYKATELFSGLLAHLGITLTSKGLEYPTSILPPKNRGRYSKRNIDGVEIVRRDLPMEKGYNAINSPNWGDWSNGSHIVELPYDRYQRDFKPPRELTITIGCKDPRPKLPYYIIAFRVEEILSKRQKDFKEILFEDLNLLQENVSACGLEPSQNTLSDYAKSLHLSWEILPPGTREEAIARLFRGSKATPEEKNNAGERYDFFMSLKPKKLVFGSSGFRRYFGALIDDNLVVFENIQYGNAIYILFDSWEELSKKSRLDLISGKYGTDFKRVVHNTGWKRQVRSIVAEKRDKKKSTNG